MVVLLSCQTGDKKATSGETYPDVQVAGAMRNVMWKGELEGVIHLDTIQNRRGLYGLGPESYLTGELLINDSQSYVSRVLTDSTMTVKETYAAEAPFFVYGYVNEWKEIRLPETVTTIEELESYIDEQTIDYKRPFVFKLSGPVSAAVIHVQNLPEGARVSSPAEAHQGQVNYRLEKEEVEIVGFLSTEHKGIFTHHDSFLHMHLLTKDGKQMGHLDEVEFRKGEVILYLPVK